MYVIQKLETLTEAQLINWAQAAQAQAQAEGKVLDRISLLASADPHWLAVQICCGTGKSYCFGEIECQFPLMSVIKPFLLLFS